MKLILDEGMPLRAAAALREAGVEAQHVVELGMGGASDLAILDRAGLDGSIIATLDADFHQILATSGAEAPSVIRIRMEGLQAQQLAILLLAVIKQTRDELAAGAFVSVGTKNVRVRRLPIRK
jgi:predicted nuclease of predicted toxin-antitoxin system